MKDIIINALPAQIPETVLSKLRHCETATIGHFMHAGFADRRIRPLDPTRRIAGTAVTVRIAGPDSAMLHHAVSQLRKGDVLLIDRCGDTRHACLGGGVAFAAAMRGIEGAVIDGPMTDQNEVRGTGLAVWSDGASAITTKLFAMPSEFNTDICIGGVEVHPGDAVLADESGVLILRPSEAEEIADMALAIQSEEAELQRRIRDGGSLGDLSGATQMIFENMRAQAQADRT